MSGFRLDSLFALSACLVLLLGPSHTKATPDGAPLSACGTMVPQHNTNPQASESIYDLRVERASPDTFSVSIVPKTGAGFQGFLIQARRDGSDTPIGTFQGTLPAGTKFQTCSAASDSVTHNSSVNKNGVTFTWRSPGGSLAGVRFVATTCLDMVTFWVKYTSIDLGTVPL